MFDFFKNTYYELQGFDMDKVKEERLKDKEDENILFDTKMKIIFCGIGAVLFFCYLAVLLVMAVNGNWGQVVKSVLLILVTVATMICVVVNDKKVQTAGIVGMVIVMILTMLL